jgi:DNA modification methylase
MDTNLIIQNIEFEDPKESGGTTYLTHDFHSYPAKFIPQIPNATIKALTKEGDVVLDPFGGCGTTIVEAKLLNRKGIAVDLNPVGVLVSKTKTTKLTNPQISNISLLLSEIKEDLSNYYNRKKTKINYKTPNFSNISHWFKEDIIHELSIIKAHIETIKDSALKNYLYTAFSSIIVNVSNQESDTRFAAIEKKNLQPFISLKEFSFKLNKMNKKILKFSEIASSSVSEVFEADSRNLKFLRDNSVDHIVTSPPYANTYDYYLYHKFRIFWLGKEVKEVQDKEIGSRNRHSSKKEGIETFEQDLSQCFSEMSRVLKPNKYIVVIIGDSVIRGNLIRADKLMEKICSKNNLRLMRTISYNLKKNSRMFNPKFTNGEKEEHIMFFKNMKNG